MPMRPDLSTPLVSAAWLAREIGAPDLRLIDATWYLPGGGDAAADHAAAHIPGAPFFDIDGIADRASDLPHMLPRPQEFARAVGRLGVGSGDRVVVYDRGGVHSAARLWWMFRVFDHDRVAVLDGGLDAWRGVGGAVRGGPETVAARTFEAGFRPQLVADRARVLATIADDTVEIVDARSAARFRGEAPEPRPGLARGHIPRSRNLPFDLLYRDDGRLAEPERLRRHFAAAGVNPEAPLIATCGSGISACSIALAAARLGNPDCAVYDGSWAEWGADPALPRAMGPHRDDT
ncbi:MAG: 3-mercaptopyruvate sulfurtransferase [Alphaproteobacteria bacterium]|nr:MAG: 3-mercaptopyruvate sulfurtransferase [Alphaproteobacteria bacterium]